MGSSGEAALADANVALANLQANLELDDVPSISEEIKADGPRLQQRMTAAPPLRLRDWLEALRAQLVADGAEVPRPEPGDGAPNEKITDWLIKINALIEKLTAGVPADPEERNEEQQARWILANILDWHRREEKAVWWEYFRLSDLSAEDLLDERAGLSGLTLSGTSGERQPHRSTDTAFHRRRPSFAAAKNSAMSAAQAWHGRGDLIR